MRALGALLLALDLEGCSAPHEAERTLATSLLSAAVFGVPRGADDDDEWMALPLRQLHGLRLVTHVRALGVLSDALRDEIDNVRSRNS